MISTSCITGTGFMKCMPITCPGRPVAAASLVIEIELVLVARIAPGRQMRSSSVSTFRLTSSFSTTASTTRSASAKASSSPAWRRRERAACLSSAVILPLVTPRSRPLSIAATPRASASGATSTRITARPLAIPTCAMPWPMVPAPTTPRVRISMHEAPCRGWAADPPAAVRQE